MHAPAASLPIAAPFFWLPTTVYLLAKIPLLMLSTGAGVSFLALGFAHYTCSASSSSPHCCPTR